MIAKHWTQGGTGITNFHVNERKFYSAVIEEYGDDNIFIGPPLEPLHKSKNILALHSTLHDLSAFWTVFAKVRTSLKEKKKHQDCLRDMNRC